MSHQKRKRKKQKFGMFKYSNIQPSSLPSLTVYHEVFSCSGSVAAFAESDAMRQLQTLNRVTQHQITTMKSGGVGSFV
jgi:hypothetical protein